MAASPTQESSTKNLCLNKALLPDPDCEEGHVDEVLQAISEAEMCSGVSATLVNPHRSIFGELRQAVYVQTIIALVLSSTLSFLFFFMVMDRGGCLGSVPRWKPAITLNLLVAFCVMVVRGVNAEMCMLGVSAVAIVTQCLDPKQLYKGAASDAVVSLALLFPIAKALAETGAPDAIIGALIGNPRTVRPGISRMFLALMPPSPFFNNTPIVAMMIPVLQSWSSRLGFDVAMLLMPLSFCAQAGGNLSLMGSSINFVAQQVFAQATNDGFLLGFFSLTIGGAILYVFVALYCIMVAPLVLKRNASSEQDIYGSEEAPSECCELPYRVAVLISCHGPVVGMTAERIGLHRVKGVSCTIGSFTLLREGAPLAHKWEDAANLPLKASDVLILAATAEGVVALRHIRGIELANEERELSLLGAMRRKRVLVEASVSKELLGKKLDVALWKRELRCAVVAILGVDARADDCSHHGHVIQQNDVFLLEAFKEDVGSGVWARLFGVVRVVPKSSPPRRRRRPDTLRAIAMAIGLIVVITLATLNNDRLQLPVTCTILLCALFLMKAMTVEEAYQAVNVPVLMTIIGALALGSALEEVRLAQCFADSVVGMAQPFGKLAILGALYISSCGLGLFVSNAAVVAIMGHIGAAIALDPSHGVSIGEVCLVVVYSSSACWCTPFGYQTNLMVAKEAGYVWGDFLRFGLPLQVLHMVVTVCIAPFLAQLVFG